MLRIKGKPHNKITRFIVIVIGLVLVFQLISIPTEVVIDPVTKKGLEEFAVCDKASDCVSARPSDCSVSCGSVFINKTRLEEYNMKVEEMCENQPTLICGVALPSPNVQTACNNGKCAGVTSVVKSKIFYMLQPLLMKYGALFLH